MNIDEETIWGEGTFTCFWCGKNVSFDLIVDDIMVYFLALSLYEWKLINYQSDAKLWDIVDLEWNGSFDHIIDLMTIDFGLRLNCEGN